MQQPATRVLVVAEAPNKGFMGVRWWQYPYGVRFIPQVRVPKTRYDLPLDKYRTCEEVALVRDVAAFYYEKKGAFNFKTDYPSFLPEISLELSCQEKIDWVSARAKERGRTLFSSEALCTSALMKASTSALTKASTSALVKASLSSQPLTLPPLLLVTLLFASHPLPQTLPGVTIATSGHVQKPWPVTPGVPLPLDNFAFSHLHGKKA